MPLRPTSTRNTKKDTTPSVPKSTSEFEIDIILAGGFSVFEPQSTSGSCVRHYHQPSSSSYQAARFCDRDTRKFFFYFPCAGVRDEDFNIDQRLRCIRRANQRPRPVSGQVSFLRRLLYCCRSHHGPQHTQWLRFSVFYGTPGAIPRLVPYGNLSIGNRNRDQPTSVIAGAA